LARCSERFRKGNRPPHSQNDEPEFGATANIIFNLAHLGISIEDAKYFDLNVYSELIELELKTIDGKSETRKATQADINAFLT
jgi:hypothetical protein